MVAASAGGIYLLVGKDLPLKKEFVQKLRQKLFAGEAEASLNFQEFDASLGPVSSLTDFLATAPFLVEKRLAVLWNADALEAGTREALESFLARRPKTAELVVDAGEATPKKDAFMARLARSAQSINCYAPFEKDLPAWVQSRAAKRGISFDKQALLSFLERVGADTARIESSLEQLELYISPRKRVENKDVEALLGRSPEMDVFSLVDPILDRDAGSALKIARDLCPDGRGAYELVALLASQFDRLDQASRGAPASELKVHPFFMERFLRQAGKLSPSRGRAVLEALLKCDAEIKTGALKENLAMEQMLLRVCS